MQKKEFKKEIKMRVIKEIHIHCSATREGQAITADTIRRWHLNRGWSDIGYHYIIGHQQIEFGRPLGRIPASVRGHNKYAAAICYIGGLDSNGKAKDTRTERQKELLIKMIKQLKHIYPDAKIHGHRDLSPDKNNDGKIDEFEYMKQCPCFDAEVEYLEFQPKGFKPKSAAGQKAKKKKESKE